MKIIIKGGLPKGKWVKETQPINYLFYLIFKERVNLMVNSISMLIKCFFFFFWLRISLLIKLVLILIPYLFSQLFYAINYD